MLTQSNNKEYLKTKFSEWRLVFDYSFKFRDIKLLLLIRKK